MSGTPQVAKQEEWEEKTKLGKFVHSSQYLYTLTPLIQPTSSVHLKRMKLCFLIPYGKNKKKKRGSGRRRMGRKSDNSKSAPSFVSLAPHPIPTLPRAVAARTTAVKNPTPVVSNPNPKLVTPQPPSTRRDKKSFKGVVVKRKAKPPATTQDPMKEIIGDGAKIQPDAKRRKLSQS